MAFLESGEGVWAIRGECGGEVRGNYVGMVEGRGMGQVYSTVCVEVACFVEAVYEVSGVDSSVAEGG